MSATWFESAGDFDHDGAYDWEPVVVRVTEVES